MKARGTIRQLVCLALFGGVAVCAGPGVHKVQIRETTYYPSGFDPAKDPYWEDPKWDETLLDSVQAAVHDPADAADTSAPSFHATVKFTYLGGVIEYPEIVASTGNPDLDKLMLHQVASVQVPQPTADLQTDVPHEFVLDLDMPTPFETFQSTVYAAIDAQKIYPRDPIIQGITGNTAVNFDYLDGKASAIVLATSSKDKELDRVSVGAVTKAVFPSAPAAYAGKTLHMQALFCYTLVFADNGAAPTIVNKCPAGRNVIIVQGTRIKTVTVTTGRLR